MFKTVTTLRPFRSLLTVAGALLLTVAAHNPAFAQACDPQFMDAIEARGFAEAARENAQNQNLIYKPDGVFEYSCFRNHISLPQTNARDLFRDTSLQFPTTDPVERYTNENFGHEYLNGRINDPAVATPAPTGDMCNAIAAVWDIAHCINFYNREDLEGLFDLTHYTSNDPRQLPSNLPACAALPYTGVNMALDIAYNGNTSAWTMGPYARDDENYLIDPVDLQLGMYRPGTCGTAIPTGMVIRNQNAPITEYIEHTCSNPACVFTPQSYDTGNCTMP